MAEVFLNENLPEEIFGAPKAGAGMWASCIRVMDPIQGKTVQKIKLEQNEAAMSLCFVKFNVQPEFTFCLVGVAKDYKLNPRSAGGGKYITTVFKFVVKKKFVKLIYSFTYFKNSLWNIYSSFTKCLIICKRAAQRFGFVFNFSSS